MSNCNKDDEYIGFDHCVTCAKKEIARLGAALHGLNRDNAALRSACKAIVSHHDDFTGDTPKMTYSEMIDRARAAIANAENGAA